MKSLTLGKRETWALRKPFLFGGGGGTKFHGVYVFQGFL